MDELIYEMIQDKIIEAENCNDPNISEQYLEGYKNGLNHALIIIEELKKGVT